LWTFGICCELVVAQYGSFVKGISVQDQAPNILTKRSDLGMTGIEIPKVQMTFGDLSAVN
jgi:hypothetical protein